MEKLGSGGVNGGIVRYEVLAGGEEDAGQSDDVWDEVGELAVGISVEDEGFEVGFGEGFRRV